jgi:hypothetical protein
MDDPVSVEHVIAFPPITLPVTTFDTMDDPVSVEYDTDSVVIVEP